MHIANVQLGRIEKSLNQVGESKARSIALEAAKALRLAEGKKFREDMAKLKDVADEFEQEILAQKQIPLQ